MGGSFELLAAILGVIIIAGVSGRIRYTILTIPMMCMLIGLASGLAFDDRLALSYDNTFVKVIATITLAMLLTTDASRIGIQDLYRFRDLPSRLLVTGMPLTMLIGTIVANFMSGELNF
jgi:NhaP-type Na+/H+ or K+/H+ antiporter